MGIIFTEGADWLTSTSALTYKWSTVSGATLATGSGRLGTNAILCDNIADRVRRSVTSGCDFIVGFAVRIDSLPSSEAYIMRFLLDGAEQLILNVQNTGALDVEADASLGTSTSTLSPSTWHYIEIATHIANSGGSFALWVDGDQWLTATGVDTQDDTSTGVDLIELSIESAGFGAVLYDDIYVIDPTDGTYPTARLGDVFIQTLSPCANGGSTAWTPSAGTNWQNVDDADPDGDSTYNYANTASNRDSFSMEQVAASSASHFAVALYGILRKDSSGSRAINFLNELSGSVVESGSIALALGYTGMSFIRGNSPCNVSWEAADITDGEFGVEIYS